MTTEEVIKFKKLHPDAVIPVRATPVSAGFDLYSLENIIIPYGQGSVLVPTGIAVKLPPGTYGRIAMRSGLSLSRNLAVSAGVIDVDYTGAVGVVVFTTFNPVIDLDSHRGSHKTTFIKKGERFAQLIVEKISYAPGVEVVDFEINHGTHVGFGSTGNL